jgi:hypothetical protein
MDLWLNRSVAEKEKADPSTAFDAKSASNSAQDDNPLLMTTLFKKINSLAARFSRAQAH